MGAWKRVDGVLRRTQTFVVEGRLFSAKLRGPRTEFSVEVPEDGGLPISVEGTMSWSAWDRLTDPMPERRLRLTATNGPTKMECNDALPNGGRSVSKGRVRFSLILNDLLETTAFPQRDRASTFAGVTFGQVPYFEPTFNPRTNRLTSPSMRVRAQGWDVRLAPTLSYPRTAPDLDGLVIPARATVSLRSEQLTRLAKRSRKRALSLVRTVGDDIAATLSLMIGRRTPWIHADLVAVGARRSEHRRFFRPVLVSRSSVQRRPLLVRHRSFKPAFGAALRTLFRFRSSAPDVADTLNEAMFLFASAVEEEALRRSWYSIALCLDLLGGSSALRAGLGRQAKKQVATAKKELTVLLKIARKEAMSAETRQRLGYVLSDMDRVPYRGRIEGLVRSAGVDTAPLGGDDLLRDIVEIRNGLMHRGRISEEKLRVLQKRGAKRGLFFPAGELPRSRVGSQLMYERRGSALRLVAQVLLRLLGVPDSAAPLVWRLEAIGGPF